LSVLDITGEAQRSAVREIAETLITNAACDGYAAREVLAHPGCTALITNDQVHSLARLLDRCALARQYLPAGLKGGLSAALDASETVICDLSAAGAYAG
jgi:hypothetical protein